MSNILVDLNLLSFKPFNCRKCLGFWTGCIISVALYLTSNLIVIELAIIPLVTYIFNKIFENYLL